MSTRLFDHAANSPTLHVQETIAALFGGSQEPLMLLVENATEGQVIQDLTLWTLEARDAIAQRLTTSLTTFGIRGTLSGIYYGIYIVPHFTFHGRSDMQDAMQVAGLGGILSALTTLEGFVTLALSVHYGICVRGAECAGGHLCLSPAGAVYFAGDVADMGCAAPP